MGEGMESWGLEKKKRKEKEGRKNLQQMETNTKEGDEKKYHAQQIIQWKQISEAWEWICGIKR